MPEYTRTKDKADELRLVFADAVARPFISNREAIRNWKGKSSEEEL